jgi:hypothetical protein
VKLSLVFRLALPSTRAQTQPASRLPLAARPKPLHNSRTTGVKRRRSLKFAIDFNAVQWLCNLATGPTAGAKIPQIAMA